MRDLLAVGLLAWLVGSAGTLSAAPLTLLPLAGHAASPDAEISAMCWCGDRLVLVPQHPERFASEVATLGVFVVSRGEVEAVIADPSGPPLQPRLAVLEAPGLLERLPGWDGIEAVVSHGDTVFMAVEARVDGRMTGYLLRGLADPCDEPWRMRVDTERVAPITVPNNLPNMSQEALVVSGERLAVIFEANGRQVNPAAHVALYDFDLGFRGTMPLDHVEYRVTDACRPLADGSFWVINYFFPPEGVLLAPESAPERPVEQLLELRLAGGRVSRTARQPLTLRDDPEQPAHNWEALVRLGDRGFLVMTDRYPSTLLAFVPLAASEQGDRP